MAAAEEEEVVRRLRRMEEAYEQDPSFSGAKNICHTFRLLSSHISSVPDSVLVKVWLTMKDEILKQIHLYKRKIKPCNPTAEPDKASIDLLLQTISLFSCHCPDLPFDLFWEECAWALLQLAAHEETEVAMGVMYQARDLLQGLIHLMAGNCSRESPFSSSRFEEASVAKLYVLLRLTLELEGEDGEFLVLTSLFPKWNACKNTRLGFQIIMNVVQKEAAYSLDVTQPAENLLKEFRLANEEEWNGCLASLLHQILQTYLEKGPMFLQQKPTRALLRLFSSQTFAQSFLDCLILNPDPHRSSASALAGAFQIFELVYAQHCETIVSCCLAKAVDEQSDLVFLRLQCLNLVGKIQAHKWNFPEESDALRRLWADKEIRNLFKTLLQDSSIRVRRSAMQIFVSLSASNVVNEKEMLKVCLMKARDQDEKVRLMAFQNLRKIPMKTLVEGLAEVDWKYVCKQGYSEENKEVRGLVEGLLLDYITTELVAEPPSNRLQILNLVGAEGDWSEQQHFSFVYENVESIWNKELEYLSAILIP